jgi:hypothetical protein
MWQLRNQPKKLRRYLYLVLGGLSRSLAVQRLAASKRQLLGRAEFSFLPRMLRRCCNRTGGLDINTGKLNVQTYNGAEKYTR